MNERTQTGLLACLLTFALCGVPGIWFLWSNTRTSGHSTAPRFTTPAVAAPAVPSPKSSKSASQELRIEQDPITGANRYLGPWTSEQIEDAELAGRQARAQVESINRSSERWLQENMLNRVLDRSRRP